MRATIRSNRAVSSCVYRWILTGSSPVVGVGEGVVVPMARAILKSFCLACYALGECSTRVAKALNTVVLLYCEAIYSITTY